MPPSSLPPQDLPRLLMRRSIAVAAGVVLVALALGLWRTAADIDDELEAAMALAQAVAHLAPLANQSDDQALAALQVVRTGHPLRHLQLQVRGKDGRLLLGTDAPAEDHALTRGLLALHAWATEHGPARSVAWAVPRPDGTHWTVQLTAAPDSERREALASLRDTLLLLLAGVAGLLLVMRWNLRHALAPLGRLLAAMAGIEARDARAVQALPPMPVRELAQVAAALRHLAGALDEAEAQRRVLSRQVLTLQEDERARLARELHDEFGQRLTAMRADAAWLARRVAGDAGAAEVVQGLAQQCQHIQQDVRQVLARLQPLGPAEEGHPGETPQRLAELLHALASGWSTPGRGALQVWLQLQWRNRGPGHGDPVGPSQAENQPQERVQEQDDWYPWPQADGAGERAQGATAPAAAKAVAASAVQAVVAAPADIAADSATSVGQPVLPRALALTLYRISQEALTNVARHAQARQAWLTLRIEGAWHAGAAWQVHWSVQDDGLGLADAAASAHAGNGLAGLRERVWSQGADLAIGPALPVFWGTPAATAALDDAPARPGLRLAATFLTTCLADVALSPVHDPSHLQADQDPAPSAMSPP